MIPFEKKNMAGWNLEYHGTSLERDYYIDIRRDVPNYEIFWSRYIGTKDLGGLSTEIDIPCISPDKDILRKQVGQWNYTALINCLHLNDLDNESLNYSPNKYLSFERIFLSSIHLFYAGMECISKIYWKLSSPSKEFSLKTDLREPIIGFLKLRHMTIHDVRPLIQTSEIEFKVPDPDHLNWFNSHTGKNIYLIWSDPNSYKHLKFDKISKFISRLKETLKKELDNVIAEEMKRFSLMGIGIIMSAPTSDPNTPAKKFDHPRPSGASIPSLTPTPGLKGPGSGSKKT